MYLLIVDAAPSRQRKQPRSAQAAGQPPTARTSEQQAVLVHVLKTILTDDYEEAAWQAWVEGPPAANATCQIQETQVAIPQLSQLEVAHCPVLKGMHIKQAFTPDAWASMQFTMTRLEAEAAQAGSSSSPVPTDAGFALSH